MAKSRKAEKQKTIETYDHKGQTRPNNPHVGLVNSDNDDSGNTSQTYQYDPHLDPQLVWAGKAERTSFEVPTVSLHVHERIDPRTIVEAVQKKDTNPNTQPSLFETEDKPYREAIEFYKHSQGWANRLIAGDSLLVMNSLLQKESMGGKVQMIYFDPPYGIKYGSNFQPFVNKRDVKDGKDEDLTQEPEMIKAFRDTWELGIHSYLSYMRDRLLLAKELLHESGSIFVQISDENVHHVREIMDEIYGKDNFVVTIIVKKKSVTATTEAINDYLLWYCKNRQLLKFRRITEQKDVFSEKSRYTKIELPSGKRIKINEATDTQLSQSNLRYLNDDYPIVSQDWSDTRSKPFTMQGQEYKPGNNRHWTLDPEKGMRRLEWANRLRPASNTVRGIVYFDDYGRTPIQNIWNFHGESQLVYVVQTNRGIVERCLEMTTDVGDLVLDITCGSGTTAYVAEELGRRWMTCDTSRIAIALAKKRLMTALYDYYELAQPTIGIAGGLKYKTSPTVTLKGIAENTEVDSIYEKHYSKIFEVLSTLNLAAKQNWKEWEVPSEENTEWSTEIKNAHKLFYKRRASMQSEINESIIKCAPQETLYDEPFIDNTKVRITGPFTVEAVPSPTVRPLEDISTSQPADASVSRSGATLRHDEWKDELFKTGIRGKAGQRIEFSRVETLAGTRYLQAEAETKEDAQRVVISFGPDHAPLEQLQVEHAIQEAMNLYPRPKMIIFAAFQFDPEAAKDIDMIQGSGFTLLKAQMNADLLTDDLKKKRSSNDSFWLVGQPDVAVVSEQWLVDSMGRRVMPYDIGKKLSGFGSLAEINGLSREDLSVYAAIAERRDLWTHFAVEEGCRFDSLEYSRGASPEQHGGVSAVSGHRQGFASRIGDAAYFVRQIESCSEQQRRIIGRLQRSREITERAAQIAPQTPLVTRNYSLVTVLGFDYYDVAKGTVDSGSSADIAMWMLDTDYDGRSLFPRQVFFPLSGTDEGWAKLAKNLKAEIDTDLIEAYRGIESLPFEVGEHKRIAVKIIDRRGIESLRVMDVA